MEDDAEIRADQANFEYPPRIVPYTGFPDYDDPDPDDEDAVLIPGRQNFSMEYEVREVRRGRPL